MIDHDFHHADVRTRIIARGLLSLLLGISATFAAPPTTTEPAKPVPTDSEVVTLTPFEISAISTIRFRTSGATAGHPTLPLG